MASITKTYLSLVVVFLVGTVFSKEKLENNSDLRNTNILVIGGGISGLVASAGLRNLGFNVNLIEASERIGGRIRTEEFGQNQYIELGAEWIHGEINNSVYQLMEQMEVLVSEDEDGVYLFANQSGYLMRTEFDKEIFNLAQAIDQGLDKTDILANRKMSVGELAEMHFRKFLKKSDNPFHLERPCLAYAALDWIHRSMNLASSANDWFQTSAVKDKVGATCPGNQGVYWKRPYTYTTLIKYVLTGELEDEPLHVVIPDWVHLGKEAIEIRYFLGKNSKESTQVLCRDGSQYTADHVISTVSLGVLKHRHTELFNPPLPKRKQLAIKYLGFGAVNKIYLNFDNPFWLKRTATPKDYDDPEAPNTLPDKILDGVQFLWEKSYKSETCSQYSFNETLLFGHWNRNATRQQLLDETDGIPEWCRDISGFSTIRNHPTALQAYVTGSSAKILETLSLEEIKVSVMKVLRKFGSRIFTEIPDPIAIKTSNWRSNPFTRGSYSFRTVDSEIMQVYAEDLAIPILNIENKPIICFAGEATHPQYYSHAHGAFATGLREAERIHKFYQNQNINYLNRNINNAGETPNSRISVMFAFLFGIKYI